MKVKELLQILKKYPEHEVLIASDEEGNSFGIIAGGDEAQYCFEDYISESDGRQFKALFIFPFKRIFASEFDKYVKEHLKAVV